MGLVQKFMAQFPVIGPHAGIECELMLAGIKPVTWMPVLTANSAYRYTRGLLEEQRRRILLDRAVEEGKLISRDIYYRDSKDVENIERFYAQPDREDLMNILADDHEKFLNGQMSEEVLDYGSLLGYRKRDCFYFNHTRGAVKSFSSYTNIAFLWAYQNELLKQNGIKRLSDDELPNSGLDHLVRH